ncbi:T9SS type A sorting domain-containing protein, partial [candidate division TA06 bacterium]|nr:T9SS type A sorting domain-containing protein [candidate division TA06 bacterium]
DGATNATATVAAGTKPIAAAVNPVTNKIFVANNGSDNVTVIDGADNDTTTVPSGSNPRDVAVNPVTNKIYVINDTNNNLTIVDGITNDTNVVIVGNYPVAVAVNPVTNKIYVANYNGGDVSVIDEINKTTASVFAGTNPYAIAVNLVTNKIYVANYYGNNVTVIDGATNATTTVTAGTTPVAVAVNPVTNKIYVANWGSNNVTVIDGADNSTINVIAGTNPGAVAVNRVTDKIYVPNQNSANVTVIDGITNLTATVPTGSSPKAVAVNPMTNKIYVANYGTHNTTVIDGATNATTMVSTGLAPGAIAVNPVTNKIYVANNSSVMIIDGATNDTTTGAIGNDPYALAVNPVTNKVYITNYIGENVTVIDEVREWNTGLEAFMDHYQNNRCYSKQPDLYGTAMMNWNPTSLPVTMVLNDWMTGQDSLWNLGTVGVSKTEFTRWQYNWGADSLLWGENYINIVPLETNSATTNNLGLGTPMAGNMLTYPIYYMDNVAPSTVSLVSPANDTIARDSLFTFVWTAATDNYGMGSYRFKIWASDTVDTIVTGTSISLKLDVSDTLYHWQVRAIDLCGNEEPYSQTRNLQLDLQDPEIPNLVSPWNNAWCADNSMICTWTEVAKKASFAPKGAPVEYVIQLDTVSTFISPMIEDTTAILLDTFNLTEGKYYWRVKAFDLAGNYGSYSGYRTFGIDTTAPLFQSVKSLPEDQSSPYGPYEVTAKAYDLCGVKSAYLFTRINAGTWDSTAMFFASDSLRDSIPQLSPATDETLAVSYYIKATDMLDHQSISSTYSFKAIGPLGVAGNPGASVPAVFALNGAYPNPSRGQTTFKYQLPKATNVSLTVYNVAGQTVKRFNLGTKPAGYHAINWNGSQVAAGVYIYRLQAGEYSATKKLMLLK